MNCYDNYNQSCQINCGCNHENRNCGCERREHDCGCKKHEHNCGCNNNNNGGSNPGNNCGCNNNQGNNCERRECCRVNRGCNLCNCLMSLFCCCKRR